MKHLIAILFALTFELAASAQSTVKYGYLNADSLLCTLPAYQQAEQQLAQVRAKYEAETAYNERTFRRQYAELLEGQKQFSPTILAKRQADLQESLEKALAFRQKADSLLAVTRENLIQPVREKLNAAIRAVGLERGYECIVNTAAGTHPFLHPSVAEDATPFVREKVLAE